MLNSQELTELVQRKIKEYLGKGGHAVQIPFEDGNLTFCVSNGLLKVNVPYEGGIETYYLDIRVIA